MDIVFIISSCRNNPSNSFIQQLNLLSSLLQSAPVALQSARIAIISVSNGARLLQDFTNLPANLSALKSAHIQPKGLCTFGEGLETTSALFKAKGLTGVPQILIVLLAGKSDDDMSKPSKELHEAGVLEYIIALNNMVNESNAMVMASDPVSEFLISSPGFSTSGPTKQAVLEKLDSGL